MERNDKGSRAENSVCYAWFLAGALESKPVDPEDALPRDLSRRSLLVSAAAYGAAAGPLRAYASEEDPLPTTARLNGWLESRYDFWLARSPMQQSFLGLKTDLDKWDDIGEIRAHDDVERIEHELTDLRDNFRPAALTDEGRLNFRLYVARDEALLDDFAWRQHAYPLNQVNGWQQRIPSFLMNIHAVASVEDAQAYVARLRGVGVLVDQVIEQMRLAEVAGILAPQFSYANALRDCRNVLTGAPFMAVVGGGESPLWTDFSTKIDRLEADDALKVRLRAEGLRALVTVVRPAFLKLIAMCTQQAERAGTDDGVWKHPDGEAYYASRLARHTTTTMTAAEIHAFGLSEVARLHAEMQTVLGTLGFNGDLQLYFAHLKNDPTSHYPQTADGKAAYLKRAQEILTAMDKRLGEVFPRRPRTPLVVRPVEAYREQSATAAFYQAPSATDGRPGTYYVNTFDMTAIPKYEMEALAYHEGIPGHHLQIALTQEVGRLPSFRRFSSYTAFDEGWGLYSERLAKEMGFYTEATADFGRLASELWRACRMVVDTGIHMPDKKWTRAQAIDYLAANTPNSQRDIYNSVERYIVDPGQATAYTIGMNRIMGLRAQAKAQLGEKFDLRAFHAAVLDNGSLPMSFLAETVEEWIRSV